MGLTRLPAATRRLRVGVVAILVLFSACGGNGSSGGTAAPTTSTSAPGAVAGLDFVGGSEVELGDGWTVVPCEGGPPLFCVRDRAQDGTQAVIELISVATDSYPAVKRSLDSGGTPADALTAQAAEYHRVFEADRASGCGPGYRVEAIGPEDVTVGGQPGVLYGFDGYEAARNVERNLHFATIRGATLHIVTVTAVDDDTCMDDGALAEFTVAEITDLYPRLVQMVAASTLPPLAER